MKQIFNATTARLCGHADVFGFHSGTQNRMQDRLYASATVCGACRCEIQAMAAPEANGFYKLSLPALGGYPRNVSWANGIRIAKLRAVGPVMAKLSKSSDRLAAAALAAYEMLFQITDSKFWVNSRESSFGPSWVVNEIEALMRVRESSVCRFGAESAYGYWMTVNLAPILKARALLPNPVAVDVLAEPAQGIEQAVHA